MTTTSLTRPARSARLRAGAILRRPCPHEASRRPQPSQVVLHVELVNTWGETWTAIGGGNTTAEAIAFARDSAPASPAWEPIRWTDLHGD